jgi:hypothetical protein
MKTLTVQDLCRGYLRKIQKKSLIFNKAYRYVTHPGTWMERVRVAGDPNFSSEEGAALERLRRDNFHRADALVDGALLTELLAEAEGLLAGAENAPRSKTKNYWSQLLPRDLDASSIYVRFALQERILKLIGAYFGESPFLQDINILASFATDSEKWQDSQLWHQDYGDSKVLKLWVYLTDVQTPETGPFTYLPGHLSRRVPNPFQRRVSDETMAAAGFDKQAVAVTGPRASTFLIDTRRCYHQGSRVAQGHRRVAYVATYVSFASLSGSGNQVKGRDENWSRRQQLAIQRT